MREFGGVLELIEGWTGNIFKNMDWVKRKGTTGKVEPYTKFLEEDKFLFQLAISKFVSKHDLSIDLVPNVDQTSVSYVSSGKYTFDLKGSTTVAIRGVDDRRKITATFAVSASRSFLPIALIYNNKTKCSLPKYDFPNFFNVRFPLNHWSNFEKCVSLFEKIILLYIQSKKKELSYLKEQYSLIVMDTFKCQDNAKVKELCSKNECELVIVPHNLTNKF